MVNVESCWEYSVHCTQYVVSQSIQQRDLKVKYVSLSNKNIDFRGRKNAITIMINKYLKTVFPFAIERWWYHPACCQAILLWDINIV